ncbi:MAG: heme biosynthesis HemY N-terminal domain-containing protein [Gammaproteobacteria bacterium]|nr:heme biosynthesis HemY N-terminal domain-containing protein [Gammaproteobacteria bacterium]
MLRFIIKLLAVIVIALVTVMAVQKYPGFVMVRVHDWTIETTLWFAGVALIVIVVALYYAVRFLRGMLRLPDTLHDRSVNRRHGKARKHLNQGLIDLAEGRFAQAEQQLMRQIEYSESPLVHYLAAARAAQLQGKHDARDNFLKAAHEANPAAELAIGVTQAELQLAAHQSEQALATLSHLHGVAPRHDHVTRLLARAHSETGDWTALVAILPDLRRRKLLDDGRLHKLELAGYRGVLEQAAGSEQAFAEAWSKVPKALQGDPEMLHFYLDRLARNRWSGGNAEQLLVKALENRWNNALIEAYGRYEARDPNAQLTRAEAWLDDFGHNEDLLLALGRIAMRARLWGKAQGYLEASIGARPMPAACLALAELLEQHLQHPDQAARYYQQGLRLCLEAAPGTGLVASSDGKVRP